MTELIDKVDELWATPKLIFDIYDEKYHFTLDAYACKKTAMCENYYSHKVKGYKYDWDRYTVWCKPPNDNSTELWVNRAMYSKGIVVLLLPHCPYARWFYKCLFGTIDVIRGGLIFRKNINNIRDAKPKPAMVVTFNKPEDQRDNP